MTEPGFWIPLDSYGYTCKTPKEGTVNEEWICPCCKAQWFFITDKMFYALCI